MACRHVTIAEKRRCCVCPVWAHPKGMRGVDTIDPVTESQWLPWVGTKRIGG